MIDPNARPPKGVSERGRARARLWLAVVVAWSITLAGLGYASARHDPPTVPEQVTIVGAIEAAEGVTAELTNALDPRHAIVIASDRASAARPCEINPAWSGTSYRRVITAYVPVDGAQPLLARVRGSLPQRYRASLATSRGGKTLVATGEAAVTIRGTVEAPGQVALTVDTGCRPGLPALFLPGAGSAPAAASDQASAALAAMRVSPSGWRADRAECRSGGALWAVEATASAPDPATPRGPASLTAVVGAARLAGGATIVQDGPDLVAFRAPGTALVARRSSNTVTVTAITGCGT